jgi:hypothetical protein
MAIVYSLSEISFLSMLYFFKAATLFYHGSKLKTFDASYVGIEPFY